MLSKKVKCSDCSNISSWFCAPCKLFFCSDCYVKNVKQEESCYWCERKRTGEESGCIYLCCYSIHPYGKKCL